MAEYTYADVIIDPSDSRVEIWQKYYVGSTPTEALMNAKNGAETALLRVVDKEFMSPFFINASSTGYACLIRKKEKEKKYVPFDLSKEEDRARLRGAWIRCKDAPACEQEIIMMNGLYLIIGDKFLTTKEVLVQFEFSDGSPCGKLVEEE